MEDVFDLSKFPIHLGLGATAVVQPEFTGEMDWYQGYGERVASDGIEGRLVALHSFTESWPTWEVHPKGHEVVICVRGRMTLHQEREEGVVTLTLEAGQAAINPPGVWHTADVDEPATALFITAGEGTENRPR
jgi:quercetin dioxygenase-like cupin family protein